MRVDDDERGHEAVDLQLDRPHTARMYDYYLGGRTNFPADREAVARVLEAYPHAAQAARANRGFMRRAARLLAEHGLRQFLDIGTGIPTRPNLHEVAQSVAPECRVVYVDNDPIVLAHAQALLLSKPPGRTAYIQADLRRPEAILDDPVLHDTLDLGRPVALSMNAVLHFVPDADGAHRVVETLKSALAPGSALVISHATADFAPRQARGSEAVYRSMVTAGQLRTRAQVEQFFAGWETLEPGVVSTFRWRPDEPPEPDLTDAAASIYAGVAVKGGLAALSGAV